MAKLETVYIHHDELEAEASVPEHTVAGWAAQGWVAGPLKRNQAERDKARDAMLAAASENAERTALANELAAAQAAGDIERTAEVSAELSGEPLVDLDRMPPLPPKGGEGSDLKHWLRFAKKVGIALADDLTRGEVIEVVEAAIARSEALAAAVETAPTGQTTPTNPEEG